MHAFYICDVTKCSEERELSDAILYYYPPQTDQQELFTICSQIIGITQFLHETFAGPLVVKLQNKCYSLRKVENFLLVLRSSKVNSELLKRQLHLLISIFSFYYGGFNVVLESCDNNWDKFISHLQSAWNYCIHMMSSLFSNGLSTPVVKQVPCETHVKSHHLLDTFKDCSNIIGSALISENVLLLADALQHFPVYLILQHHSDLLMKNDAHITHNLPEGVILKYVFVDCKFTEHEEQHSKEDTSSCFTSESSDHILPQNEINEPIYMTNRLCLLMQSSSSAKSFSSCPVHVLCKYHASLPTSNSNNVRSCCDLEFQCFMCENNFGFHQHRMNCFHHQQSRILDMPFVKKNRLHSHTIPISKFAHTSKNRNKMSHRIFCNNSLRKYYKHIFYNESLDVLREHKFENGNCCKQASSCAKSAILYIHKLRNSSLYFLIKNHPSENELQFMWWCSLSLLMSLEFKRTHQMEKQISQQEESTFAIYHEASGIYFSNHMIGFPQNLMHTDLLSLKSFHSMYLGWCNKSIYACNNKGYQLFFEQKEASNQKASWIVQMYKKAHQKAKKYLTV